MTAARSEVLRDVVYAERQGFRPLSADVHLPDDRPAPVVLFLHGGGWRLGSRRTLVPHRSDAETFERIVAAGFAVVSADYRLSGEAAFPAQLDDVLTAIAWIREHGSALGLDPSRIVAWGESSGAHLAALAALEPAAGLRGVVDWYGPADLTALGADLLPEDPDRFAADPATREAGLLGDAVGRLPGPARAASPALLAHAAAPPFLILHGEADALVPFAQSARLAAALRAAGVEAELVGVPGASHLWRGVADITPIVDRSIAFARRVVAAPSR